jgi:hypothetical protein
VARLYFPGEYRVNYRNAGDATARTAGFSLNLNPKLVVREEA